MNNFNMPFPTDIGEEETLRDYSIRKQIECEEYREQSAQLKDGIRQIVMMTDDDKVVEICNQMLSEV
ncbi:hypothetical protein SBX64_15850 [Vibrio rhizosphaerae]|uniref:Uncharacterized protein n=1 Tax=Vibrio rhizosphaerae TaxID=398736 RepID=A0ABU4IX87_9VIBR|nr:hypothetical protein [Vibrio rhizosphaerae]MDW6094012.1 hypothetical protein [Vibrio rhizosphaerae]